MFRWWKTERVPTFLRSDRFEVFFGDWRFLWGIGPAQTFLRSGPFLTLFGDWCLFLWRIGRAMTSLGHSEGESCGGEKKVPTGHCRATPSGPRPGGSSSFIEECFSSDRFKVFFGDWCFFYGELGPQ